VEHVTTSGSEATVAAKKEPTVWGPDGYRQPRQKRNCPQVEFTTLKEIKEALDDAASGAKTSRSRIINEALVRYLNLPRDLLDEYPESAAPPRAKPKPVPAWLAKKRTSW
jgi:hypothetical protein